MFVKTNTRKGYLSGGNTITSDKAMNKGEQYLDHIQKTKKKTTYNNYKQGFLKFLEWIQKDADTILAEHKINIQSEDPTKKDYYKYKLEEFARAMINKGHTKNSARVFLDGMKNFFVYYGLPVKVSREYTKVIATTKTYVPTIEEFRRMFNVADIRGRTVLAMGTTLAFRVGDFLSIQKDQLPDLNQQTPIPFELVTGKEDVIAKTFLSGEVVELLKAYLPTLKRENPYLWSSNSEHSLTDTAMNDILKTLSKKANIHIPQGKSLTFHAFRKRFLSECANLRIDVNIAKILCGKSVSPDMLTYLSEVDLRRAFIDISEHLSLSNGRIKQTTEAKDMEIEKLKQENAQLKAMLKMLTEAQSEDVKEKLLAKMKEKGIETKEELTTFEVLTKMATEITETEDVESQKQRKEYQKLIEENNNH